ncbi:MAG TPA: GAF domain-containing protein [Acidobacteriaceae bacterium]|jgi:GAF domain-containing protein|nr:GAF domain-containing protein [Acidobacteriaceae bacterium]
MTDEYLGKMLGVACDMADADGATLFVVDGAVLRPYLVYRLPVEYIQGIGNVQVGAQCCGRAVEHKRAWIVADMLSDPLFAQGRAGAENSPIRAGFSVPVMDGDTVIASLACHFKRPHTPSDLDVERNQAFAKLIAITLRTRLPFSFEGRPCYVDSKHGAAGVYPAVRQDGAA